MTTRGVSSLLRDKLPMVNGEYAPLTSYSSLYRWKRLNHIKVWSCDDIKMYFDYIKMNNMDFYKYYECECNGDSVDIRNISWLYEEPDDSPSTINTLSFMTVFYGTVGVVVAVVLILVILS